MLEAGNAAQPGFTLERTRSFIVRLTASWACSRMPSPPHRPTWHCHAKIVSRHEPGIAESHRGALQHEHISGSVSAFNLAKSIAKPNRCNVAAQKSEASRESSPWFPLPGRTSTCDFDI